MGGWPPTTAAREARRKPSRLPIRYLKACAIARDRYHAATQQGNAAVQKVLTLKPFTLITPTATISTRVHGGRAKCLQRLIRLDLPVPTTVALSFDTVHQIAAGRMPEMGAILKAFGDCPLVSVRPSSEDPDWGGPSAILNIGMTNACHAAMCESHGEAAATALYLRFIRSYAIHIARLDPDMFDLPPEPTKAALEHMLFAYSEETGEEFPQDPATQLGEVLRSMARAWEGTTARLLRQAKGAPTDAGLGLVVQSMALGVGAAESGIGCDPVCRRHDGPTQDRRALL